MALLTQNNAMNGCVKISNAVRNFHPNANSIYSSLMVARRICSRHFDLYCVVGVVNASCVLAVNRIISVSLEIRKFFVKSGSRFRLVRVE